MSYQLNKNDGHLRKLENYTFKSEGNHRISPQEILALNPQIITDLAELEIHALTIP